jgi:YesN/AraC family two-component response regulator
MGYNNPKYFSSRFKKYHGLPPKRKLIKLRLKKFQELIGENPEMSCFEIGLELGVGDEKDLNKYIKKHTGTPPNKWKKR